MTYFVDCNKIILLFNLFVSVSKRTRFQMMVLHHLTIRTLADRTVHRFWETLLPQRMKNKQSAILQSITANAANPAKPETNPTALIYCRIKKFCLNLSIHQSYLISGLMSTVIVFNLIVIRIFCSLFLKG